MGLIMFKWLFTPWPLDKITSEFIKFFRDTLSENGKYSNKKVLIAQAFMSCELGYFYEIYATGHTPIDMFNSFLLAVFGTSVVVAGNNLINKKIDNPTIEPPSIDNSTNIVAPTNENITVEK